MLDKRTIKQLLGKDDPIIFELGAHHGYDTKGFLDLFPDIRIYSFEPDPRNIAIFRRYINDDRCVLEEAALSNYDGEANLHMSGGWPYPGPWPIVRLVQLLGLGNIYGMICGLFQREAKEKKWTASSSIKKPVSRSKDYPWLTFDNVVTVKAVKLDTYVKRNNIVNVDFVWMDVQGAERDVIEGAVETLKMTRFVFTEYGETSAYPEAMTRRETIRVMKEHNFELMPEYSSDIHRKVGDLLFRNKAFTAPVEVCFTPAKGRLSDIKILQRLLRLFFEGLGYFTKMNICENMYTHRVSHNRDRYSFIWLSNA